MVSFFENIQAEQGATVTPGTTSDTDTTISPINFTRTSAVVSGCVFRKPVGAPIASSLGRFCYGVPIHGWMPSNAQYQKKCHVVQRTNTRKGASAFQGKFSSLARDTSTSI